MPTYQKDGFTHQVAIGNDVAGNPLTTGKALLYNLITDMVTAGFTIVAQDGANVAASKQFLLQPSLGIDPLWTANPWRVYLEAKGDAVERNNTGGSVPVDLRGLYLKFGSPSQLPDIATSEDSTAYEYPIIPERVWTLTPESANIMPVNAIEFPRLSVRFPMSYRLTVVERGFVLAAWTQGITEDMNMMGVICVQRGIGCSGTVATTGQRPLWLVTNVSTTGTGLSQSPFLNRDGPRTAWFYDVIREFDTTTPSPDWTAFGPGAQGVPSSHNGLNYCVNFISDDREILGQALNYFPTRWQTPVTTDTGEYVLLFPFGLCTDRFAFSDEIDLLAVSKADAYQAGQIVPIDVYGDSREYTAFNSNNSNTPINYDSGIRIFIMTKGAGIA
jgi:hypothetical protein